MIRGTTPTLIFRLPVDCESIARGFITFSQNETTQLEKSFEECEIDNDNLKLKLSQEDTLKLEHLKKVQIQVRVVTKSGTALASQIFSKDVNKILKDGVI